MSETKAPIWPDYGSLDASKAVRRRADISVGAVVFVHDVNRRVYTGKNSGPNPRYHFRPERVVGETKRSWLVGVAFRPDKHPKASPSGLYGLDDVEDALWADSYAYHIGSRVGRLRDPEMLRAIAKLIGFEPEPSPTTEG